MSLIELAEKEPEKFASYSVEQIVSICDDGKLRDGSEASKQFQKFLTHQSSSKVAEYANQCLEGAFERKGLSGFVLQDVVNEIGRRLGYKVTNGLYRGKVNAVGFDGLWDDGSHGCYGVWVGQEHVLVRKHIGRASCVKHRVNPAQRHS